MMLYKTKSYSMPTFQYGTTTMDYDIEYNDDKKHIHYYR